MNSLRRPLSYANVVATLALVFAMSGGALAATHYLIKSKQQISPKVLEELKGNKGATGQTGAAGAAGIAGAQGVPGKEVTGATGAQGAKGETGATGAEGPQGPGASEITFNLPASTSPTFSNVGSAAGFTLEAKCGEDAGTHAVGLDMRYTSTVSMTVTQTETESINEGPTTTKDETFTSVLGATPKPWLTLGAEKAKKSINRFDGNSLSPKVITSEAYVVNGGPSGNCEGASSFLPAS